MPAAETVSNYDDREFRHSLAVSNRLLLPNSSDHLMNRASSCSLLDVAETRRDSGQLSEAAEAWDEIAWYARWQQARCLRENDDETGFVRAALAAFAARPIRAEPLHDLSNFYIGRQRAPLAAFYAEAAMALPKPEKDLLCVDEFMYTAGLKHAFAVAANGRRSCAEGTCSKHLQLACSKPRCFRVHRDFGTVQFRILRGTCSVLAPSFQVHPVSIPGPRGFHAVNIAVCRWGDEILGIVRAAN